MPLCCYLLDYILSFLIPEDAEYEELEPRQEVDHHSRHTQE